MGYRHLRFKKDSTFLVTGGAGFIGSNLCEAILEMGYRVVCLDDLSTGKRAYVDMFQNHPNYSFIHGDIRDYNTCFTATKDIDFVLNQAAWGSVPRSIELPLLFEEVNIRGTLNMMEASRQNHVEKFVFASSSSVYGDNPILPKKEGQEGALLSPYALTKKTNEEYGKLYKDLFDLDTYGLRYFNVFGRRQDSESSYAAVIPKFLKLLIHDQQPIIYGDGRQSRDFTYIDNVIEANLRACAAPSEVAGEVFNIASGGQEYLLDVYNTLLKALGKTIHPIFTDDRNGDIKHSNADISKAKELLGYCPDFCFADGIACAIEWYRENV